MGDHEKKLGGHGDSATSVQDKNALAQQLDERRRLALEEIDNASFSCVMISSTPLLSLIVVV